MQPYSYNHPLAWENPPTSYGGMAESREAGVREDAATASTGDSFRDDRQLQRPARTLPAQLLLRFLDSKLDPTGSSGRWQLMIMRQRKTISTDRHLLTTVTSLTWLGHRRCEHVTVSRTEVTYGRNATHTHPIVLQARWTGTKYLKQIFMFWYFCLIHNVSDQRTQQNIELLILFLQKLFRCLKLELPDRHSRTSALLTTSKTLDLRRSLHQVALRWRKWDDASRREKSTCTNLEVLF